MRFGPPRGESATLTLTVTPDMASRVDGADLHPVYSTVALAGHVEEVCRKLLVPHLEDGEEGIGHAIELVHRAPVPVGAAVTLTATVAEVGPQRLKCEVLVRQEQRLVARGSFEQRVVDRADFRAQVEGVPA